MGTARLFACIALTLLAGCEGASVADGGCREPQSGAPCSQGEVPCAACLPCMRGGYYLNDYYCRCMNGQWYCPGGVCSNAEFSDPSCTQRIVDASAATDASD